MFSLTCVLLIFLFAVCLLKVLAVDMFFFCLFVCFYMLITSLLFGIFVQVCTIIELIILQLMTLRDSVVNSSCLDHCFREAALACHMHLAGFPEETILVQLYCLSLIIPHTQQYWSLLSNFW